MYVAGKGVVAVGFGNKNHLLANSEDARRNSSSAQEVEITHWHAINGFVLNLNKLENDTSELQETETG